MRVLQRLIQSAPHRVPPVLKSRLRMVLKRGYVSLVVAILMTITICSQEIPRAPEMNGWEATQAIREKEKTTGQHIPIVAMTAHAMKGYEEKCIAAGMDLYLKKPIRTQELFTVLNKIGKESRGIRRDHAATESS